jgi:hypothetical protein
MCFYMVGFKIGVAVSGYVGENLQDMVVFAGEVPRPKESGRLLLYTCHRSRRRNLKRAVVVLKQEYEFLLPEGSVLDLDWSASPRRLPVE